MRHLASIQRIIDLKPIPEADRIEVATINGWEVVVEKGLYNIGDYCVYFEIDSFIPTNIAPFLSKGNTPKVYNEIQGERLRTVKLRKQISQGLVVPLTMDMLYNCDLGKELLASAVLPKDYPMDEFEGQDLTEYLGVVKWERPIPACLSGIMRGNFPSYIPKTDEERVQNLVKKFKIWTESKTVWEETEKLEGSSMTVYLRKNIEDVWDFGVCSRRLDLARSDTNTFWHVAIRDNLEEKLRSLGRNIAFQGELIGPNVEGNVYKLNDFQFRVYKVFDIDRQSFLLPDDRQELTEKLGIDHVPILGNQVLDFSGIAEVLRYAEGKSVLNPSVEREGIVFKSVTDPSLSFKAVSNRYLLKHS